ncbi:hypothetical protein ODZ84_12325 [Chryseobacterium fluminis]|uniref:hypothetical protein n=1 Tax=Chryseobacterium fluminis TaxID=2983606 RepID=UPI00225BA1AD|nr:hypothetical protein [Chryseobacterium sp. MMS21-Ot14]UZT96027.1 hypothetical protein ODZ84_12325 [Chryseobacterium sp. MMS21-Ot14]
MHCYCKKILSSIFIFILLIYQAQTAKDSILPAPIIQAELDAGTRKTLISAVISKKIDQRKKLNFLNITAVHSFYTSEDKVFDEVFTNIAITYNYAKSFGAGAGIKFVNTTGITPFLAAQFSKRSSRLFFTVFFSYMVINIPLREAIILINYRFPLTSKYQFFTQLLATTSWLDLRLHRRSQQQFRIGLDYKYFQYGLAADFDQYGLRPVTKTNFGFFIRKEFN